jgi:hypothetical protein
MNLWPEYAGFCVPLAEHRDDRGFLVAYPFRGVSLNKFMTLWPNGCDGDLARYLIATLCRQLVQLKDRVRAAACTIVRAVAVQHTCVLHLCLPIHTYIHVHIHLA